MGIVNVGVGKIKEYVVFLCGDGLEKIGDHISSSLTIKRIKRHEVHNFKW